ncbi:DUF2073 domain-containing protein [Candidatus Woesearchaeota archaeon]|nr:DUF2073 domain-containing protein [Candidatus Woesearchaeota archaeon]
MKLWVFLQSTAGMSKRCMKNCLNLWGKQKKMVTLQFIPYTEIEALSSVGRIRKLLNIAKKNKIVLLQGRLSKDEETELIKTTMEEINKEFRGIELAVIDPSQSETLEGFAKVKNDFFSLFLGNRSGFTVIGPASVVKSIKKNPDKIELLTMNKRRRSKKK